MQSSKFSTFNCSGLADVFFQSVAELDGGDVVVYFPLEGIGDGTGFFGDDDADDIQLFRHADGAAVAQAQVGVDIGARGDG